AEAGGTMLFVSGLTARLADGTVACLGDPAGQTRIILSALRDILREAGGELTDVVRTVTYLMDINDHSAVHVVRREFFGEQPPASTTVQVTRLFDERQLLEIEATAIIPAG
ncbi:MAG TPA: Rid family hydrolase, partial [Nakamurella sp.]|nr:Rid family hydrolase [Nakamurella sp.]